MNASRPPKTQHPDSPIAARRLALGLTQEELARRAGVSPRAVKNAEAMILKTFPTETTRLIAVVLGCTMDDLYVSRGTCIIVHVGERA